MQREPQSTNTLGLALAIVVVVTVGFWLVVRADQSTARRAVSNSWSIAPQRVAPPPPVGVPSAAAKPTSNSQGSPPSAIPAAGAAATRKPWTASRVVGSPDPPPPLKMEPAYPGLRFRNPVVMAKPPGMNRWFVGEQGGKLHSFVDDPAVARADLALDVELQLLKPPADAPPDSPRTPVDNSQVRGLEALYGLAFHPRFAENRYCYVCYVVRGEGPDRLPHGTRVSRFKVADSDPPRLDPASERVIISWLQGGHNGGCLEFGPDGCLYISTGDGGFANPPDGLDAGQDVSNLLSSILRIDVDGAEGDATYRIPDDNPLVGTEGARGEIWCYGLRNPWKMSFDRATGDLWVGDVGWELWELVYRVEKGGNYGWSVVEGRQPVHPERKVGPTPILPPTVEVPHTDGVSITGGYVYRGARFPELVGHYLFGDWETRRIWSVAWDAATKTAGPRIDLVEPTVRLVAMAQRDDGELLALDYDDGTILEFQRQAPRVAASRFPERLSETGLFASTRDEAPADGVYAFEVNSPQWSDHATARRWIATPGTGTVRMLPQKTNVPGSMFSSSTLFPADTVLVKTLALDLVRGDPSTRRRIETQLLHFDGKFWRGYSYRWNDEQTDAELVEPLGAEAALELRPAPDAPPEPHVWRFASRVECARCHNQWAEYALGFNLRQLNRTVERDGEQANQLRTLEELGLIRLPHETFVDFESTSVEAGTTGAESAKIAESPTSDVRPLSDDWYARRYPHLVDPTDDAQPLDQRARSYLHANCAHCHRTGGGGTASIELQQELPLEAAKVLDVRPTQGAFDIPDARIVAPGDPFRSTLFYRVSKTGSGRMPHVGSETVDPLGTRLLHDWIRSLPAHPEAVALWRQLSESDDAEAEQRETAEAAQRRHETARRLAGQRRDRERAAAGASGPPPLDPAPISADDRRAAVVEDERQAAQRRAERLRRREQAISKLLASTDAALVAARSLDDSPPPAGARAELIAAALGHPSPAVRDLFERFAPPDRRPKRLGAHVRPDEILKLAGDVGRGAVLFANTPGVQCKNCHQIGRIGGKVGPDLSQIGRKYDRRQMLEHILEPSKTIDPKYVSYVVELNDGRVLSGLLIDRTAAEFVLRDAKDQELRVATEDVERIAPQRQSLMPDLQLRDLTPQQTADLLTYLTEQR